MNLNNFLYCLLTYLVYSISVVNVMRAGCSETDPSHCKHAQYNHRRLNVRGYIQDAISFAIVIESHKAWPPLFCGTRGASVVGMSRMPPPAAAVYRRTEWQLFYELCALRVITQTTR